MPHRLRRLLLPCLLLAVAALLAGCEVSVGDKTIDAGSVEDAIRTSQEDAGQKITEVDCPGGQKAEQGRSFDCTVTLGNGQERTARVELVDDDGTFNYELLPAGASTGGDQGSSVEDTGADGGDSGGGASGGGDDGTGTGGGQGSGGSGTGDDG